MALKITKQTGGSFFFEPTSGKTSTHVAAKYFEYGGKLSFYDTRDNAIELDVPFASITINDGSDHVYASAKLAIDKLCELGL